MFYSGMMGAMGGDIGNAAAVDVATMPARVFGQTCPERL